VPGGAHVVDVAAGGLAVVVQEAHHLVGPGARVVAEAVARVVAQPGNGRSAMRPSGSAAICPMEGLQR
jgi:3-oxoacyl-(acyl-carrier-protein) synthase